MNKTSVFSNVISLLVLLIVLTIFHSCSETGKADPVKAKSLKVTAKKADKPSCCASDIPARFPITSIVKK
jgi:Mg2+/Co2+ transporter CorB